jgi:hypothetical protein
LNYSVWFKRIKITTTPFLNTVPQRVVSQHYLFAQLLLHKFLREQECSL